MGSPTVNDADITCDWRHLGPQPLADWVLIGESGDYYSCDEHFQQRTESGKRGWARIRP